MTRQFPNNLAAWGKVLEMRPWTLYIHGGDRALQAEDRCREAYEHFAALPGVKSVGIARSDQERHAHFKLQCDEHGEDTIGWSQLAEALRGCLRNQSEEEQHIVFDITSLELDAVLYLLPQLLELYPASLYGLYLVPEHYAMREEGLILQDIQQPRGYVSFDPGLEGARRAHHYIITGFDKGRAQRYIDAFDWGWERLHGVIGDPSYVQEEKDGVRIAWDNNRDWLETLRRNYPNQIHRLEAAVPYGVRDFFRERFEVDKMLDIVPLGPKPMLLGVLLFYLGLTERERGQVRILFDFPTPKVGSTHKVEKGYIFDCRELLRS